MPGSPELLPALPRALALTLRAPSASTGWACCPAAPSLPRLPWLSHSPPPSQPPPHNRSPSRLPTSHQICPLQRCFIYLVLPWLRWQEAPAGIPTRGASCCWAALGQGSPLPGHVTPAPPRLSGAPQPIWVAAGKEETAASPLLPRVLPPALLPPQEHSPKGKIRDWGLTHTHIHYICAGRESQPPPARHTTAGGSGSAGGAQPVFIWLGAGVGDSPLWPLSGWGDKAVGRWLGGDKAEGTLRAHRMLPPAGRNSSERAHPTQGEGSTSTSQGPLQGSRGVPPPPPWSPLSHPGWVEGVPASPPRPTSIANCLTLRLWSCRDSGVKFAEPSLFRCLHCEGWGPPLSPDPSRGCLRLSGTKLDTGSSGTWRGEPPCPPPRAPPATPRLRQPHWQPRVPPEPLGSSSSFLSLKQCCCVTHMRFPAMLCKREDGRREKSQRAIEQRAEPFCCRAGRGRGRAVGVAWIGAGAPGKRGPPSSPSLRRRNRRCRGQAPRGWGRLGKAWLKALSPAPLPASQMPFFCLCRGGF